MVDTNETLLQRVRQTDAHDAWRDFYSLYRGPVLAYAYGCGLRGPALDDVLQDTFVALVRVLPGFRYDRSRGRFRHFLLRLVHHRVLAAVKNARTGSRRHVPMESPGALETLLDDSAAESVEEEWKHARDRWRAALAAEALARVYRHPSTRPETIAIFDEFVRRGRPAAEVAASHGVTVGNVHQVRHRTLQRIQRELTQLLASCGEDSA